MSFNNTTNKFTITLQTGATFDRMGYQFEYNKIADILIRTTAFLIRTEWKGKSYMNLSKKMAFFKKNSLGSSKRKYRRENATVLEKYIQELVNNCNATGVYTNDDNPILTALEKYKVGNKMVSNTVLNEVVQQPTLKNMGGLKKPKKLSKKKSPKLHTGPRGGKYIIKKGKKIYQ